MFEGLSQDRHTSESWPIAAAMLGFPDSTHESDETWRRHLREVAFEGFSVVDLTDTWVRIAELDATRLDSLAEACRAAGVRPEAASLIRKSVIDPDTGLENLDYSHRAIDAAARLGCSIVSVGLHRPLTPAQRETLWFWTVDGPRDDDTPEVRDLAATRLRELAEHAASVGLELSLEMYEDTLLGSAESAVRLVAAIDHPAVGLNPDLGNLFRLHRDIPSMEAALELCLPVTNYWHVKNYYRDVDPATRTIVSIPSPMASGSMNYRAAITAAVRMGYRGAFCVEHYGGDSLTVIGQNMRYLRHVLASIEHAHATDSHTEARQRA